MNAKRYTPPIIPNMTGYGDNTWNPPYSAAAHTTNAAANVAIGATFIRTGITRSNTETAAGVYDWTEYDSIYAKALAQNQQLILVFETTPAWANPSFNPIGYNINSIPNPVTNYADFVAWYTNYAAWCVVVQQRYPLAIFEWWNEWATASGYWREGGVLANKPNVAAYGESYIFVKAAMKAVDPYCTLAVGGLVHLRHWFGANATTADQVIPQLLAIPGFVADAWSMHPYASDGGSQDPGAISSSLTNVFKDIGYIQTVLIANGQGDIPLWITEWGDWGAVQVGSETVKAGYVYSSLVMLHTLYGRGALGPNKAGVTIATYYPLQDNPSGAQVDSGLYAGTADIHQGVTTRKLAGDKFLQFTSSLPAYTLDHVTLDISDASVQATDTAPTVKARAWVAPGEFHPYYRPVTYAYSGNDNAVATIHPTTGIITLVGAGTVTFTVTVGAHSDTIDLVVSAGAFNPATGAFIGGSNGAVPIGYDAASMYVSDNGTAPRFRDVVANKNLVANPEWIYADASKNGNASMGSAKYTFDVNADLCVWQNVVQSFDGSAMWKCTIIGDNLGHSAPCPQLRGPIASPCRSLWAFNRHLFAGLTAVGDATGAGATFNIPQASAIKIGPSASLSSGDGRAGLEMSSGSGHSGQYESEFQPLISGSGYGISTTNGPIDPIFDVGAPEYDHLCYFHGYTILGVDYVAVRIWRKVSSDPVSAYTELGSVAVHALLALVPTPLFGNMTGLTTLNVNESFNTTQDYYTSMWAFWNPDQDVLSADPMGVL